MLRPCARTETTVIRRATYRYSSLHMGDSARASEHLRARSPRRVRGCPVRRRSYTSRSYSASTTILAGNTLTPNQSPDATTARAQPRDGQPSDGDDRRTGTRGVQAAEHDGRRPSFRRPVERRTPEANVITIKATADTPEAAAARANAVAPALIATERRIEQRATAEHSYGQRSERCDELRSAGATGTEVQAAENRISSTRRERGRIGGWLSGHPGSGAARASPLRHHRVSAESWRSVAVVVLGMLVVLAREQVAPRVSPSAKDLDTVFSGRRLPSIRPCSGESSRTLSDPPPAIAFEMTSSRSRQVCAENALKHNARIIFVVSAIGGEGRTTVAANLSQALSMSGASVLAVCADLRSPKLHEWVRCPRSPRG